MPRTELAACLSALTLALPVMAWAAAPAPSVPQQAGREQQQLDEVTVEGRRERQRKPQQSFEWLARLVGEFTIEGHVHADPDGSSGESREARGHALCVGFGLAPGVLCDLQVRWAAVTDGDGEPLPGGISTLDPAVMLFGFNLGAHSDTMYGGPYNAAADPESYTIAHILIDNQGVAETGSGFRAGTDTMTSRAPCAAIPANCERVVRIIAPDDLETVEMRIDLAIDGDVAMRHDFFLRRVVDSKAVVFGREPVKESKAKRSRR